MIEGKKVLVVSAHAADYVWRAGGTIAKYIKHGAQVHVVVLSFGVRQVALLLIVSIFVAFAASFLPVKRIASKRPIDAIRGR